MKENRQRILTVLSLTVAIKPGERRETHSSLTESHEPIMPVSSHITTDFALNK